MQHHDSSRPWLHSHDPQVPARLNYERMPLYGLLDKAAAEHPGRTAYRFQNKRASYAQLLARAEALAGGMAALGVMPGDRVALMLPNLPQTIEAFWALGKAGAVGVMTNPLYMETELLHQLNDSGAETLVVLDLLWPKVEPLLDRLGLKRVVITRISDGLEPPLNWLYRLKVSRDPKTPAVPYGTHKGVRVVRWKETFGPRLRVAVDSGDLALLQYTGGTTGVSKGVMLTHANLVANATQITSMLYALGDEQQVFIGLLPFFHVYGLMVCLIFPTAIAAATLPLPRYVPSDVLELINKRRPTIFPGAPAVYNSLMQHKDIAKHDLTCIDYCVSGSAPMPLEVMRRFTELTDAAIVEGFGLTEASPVTHLNPLKGKRKVGSIGLPFPDTDCRIADLAAPERDAAPGEPGELLIRGPQVMAGYWKRPEDTAKALQDGWLRTGDVARMDEEGYFYIVDRIKDMVITGGYNVYPREIDELLYTHPKIKEAAAVGVAHPTRGEVIKAYVVPVEGEELTKAEVLAFCRERLAAYKVPRDVAFLEELPKTVVGKCLRRVLRGEEGARA